MLKKNFFVNTSTQTFKLAGGAITDALNRKRKGSVRKEKAYPCER